ncbi:hypothetical protein BWK49_10760 [Mycobacterium intracellulare subsp. chimaera]|nr:hypothetical protein BWK49_10760 [Mycobacterium intracellulare subsp. chimaera]
MTVPWAYLHPRFQGQEPPGFPGRFNRVLGGGLADDAITWLPSAFAGSWGVDRAQRRFRYDSSVTAAPVLPRPATNCVTCGI